MVKIRKIVKRFALSIIPLLLVASVFINSSCFLTPSKEETLDGIKNWVARTRQLPELNDIEYEFITKDDLRSKLNNDFETDYDEQEEANFKELLVMLGLIDEDLDLYNLYLDLYAEQIAGYYDPETKKLYVIGDESTLSVSDKMTFAHEVTHALQDQHFDLEALDDLAGDDSEYAAGIKSLIEGDATLTQGLFYWQALNARERDIFTKESEELDMPIYDSAPRIIRESLIFPYKEGSEFVLSIYEGKDDFSGFTVLINEKKGWEAVNKLYDNPPKSMEQIMHPAKYRAMNDPIAVELPDLETLLAGSWDQKEEGSLGEFDLKLTLEAFITPLKNTTDTLIDPGLLGFDSPTNTEKAAAGWGGDSYAYLKNDVGDKILVVHSVWDRIVDAQEFFDLYSDNKAGTDINDNTWVLSVDETFKKVWVADRLVTYLKKFGDEVLLIIAPDEPIADTVRDAILP